MPDDTDPGQPVGVGPSGTGGAGEDASGGGAGAATGAPGDSTQAFSTAELREAMAEDVATASAAGADDLTGAVRAVGPDDGTGALPAGGDDLTGVMAGADATRTLPAGPDAAGSGSPAAASGPGGGRRRSSANRWWIGAVATAAVLLLGAGIALGVTGGSSPKKKAATSGAAPNIPAPATPKGPPCPLTGVPTSGSAVPARPALAIKVDNYPDARPQSGLNQADIVYEEPVEGGITRLVAVFQCQSPSLIGPIRSARAVDLQILDELSDPIFIHAGGIAPVLSLIGTGNLTDDNLFSYGSIIQTPPGRSAPYDTYVSAAAAWGLDPGDSTPPKPVFSYASTAPAGTSINSIHIPFSGTNNTVWTWNAPQGQWLLSYSGTPATVSTGGQISTTNIVVQTVHVTYGPWAENELGGLEVQSQMTGSGPLEVLRNGVMVSGTWQRSSYSAPTTLTASNGTPITLAPGRTWVEIVPSTVQVTTTSPGAPSSPTGG